MTKKEAIDNLKSHREAFKKALIESKDKCSTFSWDEDDVDDTLYWQHEVNAFDKIMKALFDDEELEYKNAGLKGF